MPSLLETSGRRRLIEGQLSLDAEELPVRYCRRCRQPLRSAASREAGMGPLCRRIAAGELIPVYTCSNCGQRPSDEPGRRFACDSCGAGWANGPAVRFRFTTRYVRAA